MRQGLHQENESWNQGRDKPLENYWNDQRQARLETVLKMGLGNIWALKCHFQAQLLLHQGTNKKNRSKCMSQSGRKTIATLPNSQMEKPGEMCTGLTEDKPS